MGESIKVLPPEEARKIAAGEVIDRPSALVREFMDNAIDAEGSQIEVLIEDGGIGLVEVSDDGLGMSREDMSICWLTHATSKIRSLEDLRTMSTLGFRGEALAAAAAVSALEVLSSQDGREAWKLSVGPGEKGRPILEQSRRTRGSSVRAQGLYDSIPARKRFLKRPGTEAAACRQIFNEKAMAFPEIGFRFSQEGLLKSFLPRASSLRERFCQIYLDEQEGAFLHEIAVAGDRSGGEGFSVVVLAGGPELFRKDRRLQFVFANNRRIQDFSLLQALEYGLEGWFPGGTHPVGAVFVNIDPALADFNIHPAKREVRFADPGAIHHAVTGALRDFCRRAVLRSSASHQAASQGGAEAQGGTEASRRAMEALLSNPPDFASLPAFASLPYSLSSVRDSSLLDLAAEAAVPYPEAARDIPAGKTTYLGRLFELFILVEKGDRLFIIDQHAAHEGILYDAFIKSPIPRQELLVPLPFSTESAEEDSFLEGKREELANLGIVLGREGSGPQDSNRGEWFIEALPAGWRLSDTETIREILNLRRAGENIGEAWMISLSCWGAVKDGDFLDDESALALAEEALALPRRHCPHGRPIYFEISRNDLLRAVKRI